MIPSFDAFRNTIRVEQMATHQYFQVSTQYGIHTDGTNHIDGFFGFQIFKLNISIK